MNRMFASLVLVCATFVASPQAASAVNIAWVPVGNPGNANDTLPYTPVGGVAYNYSIDKYDVTVGEYTEFLNAVAKDDVYGLYNPSMGTDLNIAGISRGGSSGSYVYSVIGTSANLPITYVNWGDAARFANWLQNGQPTGAQGAGTTETGAYTLNGAMTAAALNAVTRNPGATIVIPNANEWYKAAFYNPATSSYYQFPFSSDTIPTSAMPGSTPNTGNFADNNWAFAVTGSPILSSTQNYLTPVGAYTASASPYGAFDMGGNVEQWNEALYSDIFNGGFVRGLTGGSWFEKWALSGGAGNPLTTEFSLYGFRVASVPEPTSSMLLALGLLAGLAMLRRRTAPV